MIRLGGHFVYWVEHNGRIWLPRTRVHNGIITATIDDLFDTYFSNGSVQAAWYLGLISSTSFTALAATDTMASHTGWTEATNYSGNRPAWSPGSSASGLITNDTAASYTISTEETLQGMFVASDNTAGGTTGLLWATGEFSTGTTTPPVGSTFKLHYELEAREG